MLTLKLMLPEALFLELWTGTRILPVTGCWQSRKWKILPNSLKTEEQIDVWTDEQMDKMMSFFQLILMIDLAFTALSTILSFTFISSHLMPDVLSSRLILSYFTTSRLYSYSDRLVHIGEFRASEGGSHVGFISVYLCTKLVKLINLTKKEREEWRIE